MQVRAAPKMLTLDVKFKQNINNALCSSTGFPYSIYVRFFAPPAVPVQV